MFRIRGGLIILVLLKMEHRGVEPRCFAFPLGFKQNRNHLVSLDGTVIPFPVQVPELPGGVIFFKRVEKNHRKLSCIRQSDVGTVADYQNTVPKYRVVWAIVTFSAHEGEVSGKIAITANITTIKTVVLFA